MSGTEEYYFRKRWEGIEKIGRILDKKHIQNVRSSHVPSSGEALAMLVNVIEKVIHLQTDIRVSLAKSELSERDIYKELTNLEDRINWAVNILSDATKEIVEIKFNLIGNDKGEFKDEV